MSTVKYEALMQNIQKIMKNSPLSTGCGCGGVYGCGTGFLRGIVVVVIMCMVMVATRGLAAVAIAPAYQDHQQDHTWAHQGNGVYSVAISEAENYAGEVWERPIEDNKYTQSTVNGTTFWTTTGKYYAYGDLKEVAYAFDDSYFYLSIQVVGNFMSEPGKSPSIEGLKGQYYYYFGKGDNRFVLNVSSATGLGSSWSGSGVKMYKDDLSKGDVAYGSGFENNYDNTPGNNEKNFTSFSQEITNSVGLFARVDVATSTVEFALELASLMSYGFFTEDFFDLDFSIVGVAISNPSSVSNLFTNDNFRQASGQGQEYDTMHLRIIPEPGVGFLLVIASMWMCVWRRRG